MSSETEFIFDFDEDEDDLFEPVSEVESFDEYSKPQSKDKYISSESSDFETVLIPEEHNLTTVDIIIENDNKKIASSSKRIGITKADRNKRLVLHKFHLLCLFTTALLINKLSTDKLFQTWSCSLLPTNCLSALKKLKRAAKKARKQNYITYDTILKDTIKLTMHSINQYFGQNLEYTRKKLLFSQLLSHSDDQMASEKNLDSKDFLKFFWDLIRNDENKLYCTKNYLWARSFILASILRSFSIETRICFALSPISLVIKHSEFHSTKLDDFNSFDPRSSILSWCEISHFKSDKWESIDPNVGSLLVNPEMKILTKKNNMMPYIISIDKKNYVKDITPKFISSYPTFQKKYRIQTDKNSSLSWWDEILLRFKNFNEKAISKVEDELINNKILNASLPTRLSDFTNNTTFALESQLKRNQIIEQNTKIVGKYKGINIYPRSSVLNLYSKFHWTKHGRSVKNDEKPIKILTKTRQSKKIRESYINNTSIENISQNELYAFYQTVEAIRPDLDEGRIPKTKYNKIDLFHKNMLPLGTVHIPINGLGKYCKLLKIDYADSVVGFDFQKQGAVPVIEGVVILENYSETLINFYLDCEEKQRYEQDKLKINKALRNWERLCTSLLIKQRLLKEYIK
ncbi:hypothetical protein BB561_002083 [Smittium simulii]|uniref:Rad4 beta-hairpin domain-containing protein n=1 Tax=Smittium simulii TaxID=133385 RepID=A0A2T9YRR9_9FUNG|nr:hypothetical protein BB561_002083 [Smittium simulii]